MARPCCWRLRDRLRAGDPDLLWQRDTGVGTRARAASSTAPVLDRTFRPRLFRKPGWVSLVPVFLAEQQRRDQ